MGAALFDAAAGGCPRAARSKLVVDGGTGLIAGLGSPHGDDQVGWRVVDELGDCRIRNLRVVRLSSPLELLNHLEDCRWLIVVDAMRGGGEPGAVTRFGWPHPAINAGTGRSSHGVDLGAALRLANELGRLPARVVVFAIEMQGCEIGAALSDSVARALPTLRRQILDAVRRAGE